uniref:DUF6824 domain-containing protein n=1 Tax=Pseudo-nitzschia australis TaxID=44445 RepID=A0A7S4EEL1_9STRA
MTTSQSQSSTDRRSLVEDVETVHPSVAMQLLNLAGQPPMNSKQPQGKDTPTSSQKFSENSIVPSPESSTMLNDSTKSTHGTHRKKQKMLRAEKAAAAAETQVVHGVETHDATITKHWERTTPETNKKKNRLRGRRPVFRRNITLPTRMNNKRQEGNEDTDTPNRQSVPVARVKKSTTSKSHKPSLPKKKKPDIEHKVADEYADDYTEHDILLGLRKYNNHRGNQVYREVVTKFREDFHGLAKTLIARKIVDHIYDCLGGRFLKIDNNGRWKVMPDVDVMTKAAKAISELRHLNKPKKTITMGEKIETVEPVVVDNGEFQTSRGGRRKRKASSSLSMSAYVDETESYSNDSRKKKKKISSLEKQKTKSLEKQKTKSLEKQKTQEERKEHTSTTHKIERNEPKYEEYIYKPDPNDLYVEETAHIYHNPPFPSRWTKGVTRDDLLPIPPPPPLPSFPKSSTCHWCFHDSTRVLIADFSKGRNNGQPVITLEDSKFLFEMYERDDITVISRGLLNMSKVDPSLWSLEYLRTCIGREFYHKFRRFDRTVDENGIVSNTEKDTLYSMRFEDYAQYCDNRESYLKERNSDSSSTVEEPEFTFEDHQGKTHTLGVWTSALYMIDFDMNRLTPLLNENFLKSFELPAVLPGGSHCMMNSVTADARPFMGPNLYVTPPASFTHFHQDGHGTVDSGHLCISGFNEVVMFRRLTERHKKHALWILSGKITEGYHFDGLYSVPHGDGLGKKPPWPSNDMVEECKTMGYCPSIFILEPGDLVHINKGRLHAFRKMSTSKLPDWDCHAKPRQNLVESKGMVGGEKLCVSVAWDWMYRGVSSAGINREVCSVLEGSTLNRRNGVTSLAIPELALLQMAKTIPARRSNTGQSKSFLDALKKTQMQKYIYESSKEEICKGISTGLGFVVGQHVKALNVKASRSTERGKHLSIAKIPDTQENPQTCPLDPYGDSDFQCKLCRKELSNVYFHCDGCEKLLSKDFNICRGCYVQGKFMIKVQMHPSNPRRHATLNHMGDNKFNRESRCPCKSGPACNFCGYCLGCSCRCHTWFTMRTRLCDAGDEEKLLESVKCTIIPSRAKPAVEEGGKIQADVSEMEESTKHLLERLKDAGDEELLNDVKKDDDKVKEDNPEEPASKDSNSDTMVNENIGENLPSEDRKDDVKVKNEDISEEPASKERNGDTMVSENVVENLTSEDRKDDVQVKEEDIAEDPGSHDRNSDTIVNKDIGENLPSKDRKDDVKVKEANSGELASKERNNNTIFNGDVGENLPSADRNDDAKVKEDDCEKSRSKERINDPAPPVNEDFGVYLPSKDRQDDVEAKEKCDMEFGEVRNGKKNDAVANEVEDKNNATENEDGQKNSLTIV